MEHAPTQRGATHEAVTSTRLAGHEGPKAAAKPSSSYQHGQSEASTSAPRASVGPSVPVSTSSAHRTSSFNFPSPGAERASPELTSGLQQVTPESELLRPTNPLQTLRAQLQQRLADGNTSRASKAPQPVASAESSPGIHAAPVSRLATPASVPPRSPEDQHHRPSPRSLNFSPAADRNNPTARLSDISTSGSDKMQNLQKLDISGLPDLQITPDWPQRRSDSSKSNTHSRSPSKSPVRPSSSTARSDESVVTLEGGMGAAPMMMHRHPAGASEQSDVMSEGPMSKLPDQRSPTRPPSVAVNESSPITPTQRSLTEQFQNLSPARGSQPGTENGSAVSDAAGEIVKVDFTKLVSDLQDVETKVLARKMLLESCANSAASTPTAGSGRRADSVMSDGSLWAQMGTDLYQLNSMGRSPSVQTLAGEVSGTAAGPSNLAAPAAPQQLPAHQHKQPRSVVANLLRVLSIVLLALLFVGVVPSAVNHFCGLYQQQQCTQVYDQYIRGKQLVDIPAVGSAVQRVRTTLHQWHVFANLPEQLPQVLMEWYSKQEVQAPAQEQQQQGQVVVDKIVIVDSLDEADAALAVEVAEPRPKATVSEPAVVAQPEPAVAETPGDEPKPAVSVEPEPVVSVEPEPAVSEEPDLTGCVQPEPAVSIEPEPAQAVAEPAVQEAADTEAVAAEPEPAAPQTAELELPAVPEMVSEPAPEPVPEPEEPAALEQQPTADASISESEAAQPAEPQPVQPETVQPTAAVQQRMSEGDIFADPSLAGELLFPRQPQPAVPAAEEAAKDEELAAAVAAEPVAAEAGAAESVVSEQPVVAEPLTAEAAGPEPVASEQPAAAVEPAAAPAAAEEGEQAQSEAAAEEAAFESVEQAQAEPAAEAAEPVVPAEPAAPSQPAVAEVQAEEAAAPAAAQPEAAVETVPEQQEVVLEEVHPEAAAAAVDAPAEQQQAAAAQEITHSAPAAEQPAQEPAIPEPETVTVPEQPAPARSKSWTAVAILEATMVAALAAGGVYLWSQSAHWIAAHQHTPAAADVAVDAAAAGLAAIPEDGYLEEEQPLQLTPGGSIAAVHWRIFSPAHKPPVPMPLTEDDRKVLHEQQEQQKQQLEGQPGPSARRTGRRATAAAGTPSRGRGRKPAAAAAGEPAAEAQHSPTQSGLSHGYNTRNRRTSGVGAAAAAEPEITSTRRSTRTNRTLNMAP